MVKTYIDTSVINGTTYYYKVSAVDPCGESALSLEQSGTPVSLLTDLLAYWTLNEASGNRADSSGNGNTLVQTGTITGASGFGNVGNVSVWDGSNSDYLSTVSAVIAAAPFTIAGWVNLGAGGPTRLFSNGTGAVERQVIGLNGGNHLQYGVNGVQAPGTAVLSLGVWYHVCMTYDGTNLAGYVNGVLDFGPTPEPAVFGATGTFLGIQSNINEALTGSEVGWGIWGRVLSATGITNLVGGGSGVAFSSLSLLAG